MATTQDSTTEDPQRTIEALKQQLDDSRAERDAAQAQEAALSEVLEVINRSPGDLGSVFDAILEKALRLCGAAFGTLYTFDGKRFRAAAMRGLPAAYAEFRVKHPPARRSGGGPARMLETKRPLHILDLRDEEFYHTDAERRTMVALTGARSCLGVPLLNDEAMVGFVSIYRQEVRAFSDKHIALLERFAAQAAIAMENARLLGELQARTAELAVRNSEYGERIEHQAATIDVLKVMSASPGDPQPVFDLIAHRARDLCEAYGVTVYEFDGTLLHWRAATGVSDDPSVRQAYEAMYPMAPSREWPVGRAVMDGQIIQISDVEAEPG